MPPSFNAGVIDIQSFADPYQPISNYALIGNCRTAALISASGSVDWLCLPRFDSPSYFASILDSKRGGRFSITPRHIQSVHRTYVGDTNVLETTFTTSTGVMRLTDSMPVFSEQEKKTILVAQHELLRKVECLDGGVQFDVVYEPSPAYGAGAAVLEDRKWMGWFYQHRANALIMGTDVPLLLRDDRAAVHGNAILQKGDQRWFSVTFTSGEPAVLPTLGRYAQDRLQHTIDWWRSWVANCKYTGPYRDHVVRSALVLKLMCYAPSGALVAAPTTSLPEWPGGIRNWDYRYCWLRDASLTVRALIDLGFETEAAAFLSWTLHATWTTQPELQVLYDVHGGTRLPERSLDNLEGYAQSVPVRVGNDAHNQLQMDIYGEVVLAVHEDVSRGGNLDSSEQKLMKGIGDLVCRRWREPDEGIWEIRAGRRHHTYSKGMCWVALDRLIRLHMDGHLKIDVQRFARERDAIREEIERHGYNESLQSYVSEFHGTELDASLLLLAISGYADPSSPRMRSTLVRIQEQLGKNGVMYRYAAGRDGLPPGEGAFGICKLWAIQCIALDGRLDEATKEFEQFLTNGNDLKLFSEEIDPDSGRLLGNFPQAFTHLGLVDTALLLEDGKGREKAPSSVSHGSPGSNERKGAQQ